MVLWAFAHRVFTHRSRLKIVGGLKMLAQFVALVNQFQLMCGMIELIGKRRFGNSVEDILDRVVAMPIGKSELPLARLLRSPTIGCAGRPTRRQQALGLVRPGSGQ